jgi:hypothetical protein
MKKCGFMLFVCLCATHAHAQLWRDYKCFVRDTTGTAWVHLFELDAAQEEQAISALTDRSILDSFGQPLARIKTVVECVPLDVAFSSTAARQLDSVTPK